MYEFIDVTEVSESSILPSEALQINGEYIENLISGYRTLHVEGREALSPDVITYTTGVRDGSAIKSKRFPERIITVTYQLIAADNAAFREAYNQLGGILNVENAELIFNDEQDKFFVGTPCIIGSVKPGVNAVVGEFEIVCADPFKYSVVEYEAEPEFEESSVLIDYNGTYRAFPILEASFFNEENTSDDGETETELTGAGDCGFVAFFNESEKIIQLGNPDEVDGIENAYPKSQTLSNHSFNKSTSWGSAAKSQWKTNKEGALTGAYNSTGGAYRGDQAGSAGLGVASYTLAQTPASTSGTLKTATSLADAPTIHYSVKYQTSGRTETSVKVKLTVTTTLGRNASYFGSGYGLIGRFYVGGSWRSVTLKKTSEYWRGKTAHTVTTTFTVSGLSGTTSSLTGIKMKVERSDSTGGTAGTYPESSCNNISVSTYEETKPETYYLTASNYGSGTHWHGPSITRTIPADASGEVGAKNCTLTFAQKMCIGTGKNAKAETGQFEVLLSSGSGDDRRVVAGVRVVKNQSGTAATMYFLLDGYIVYSIKVDMSNGNKLFTSAKTSSIVKTGKKVTFNICGVTKIFNHKGIADLAVDEVTFWFSQYVSNTPLTHNGLYWVKFVKNNCETYREIPNKFSANDIVQANCRDAAIYLNGVLKPDLGALGNDWEDFYLTPGLNQIGVAYSEWVADEYAPSFKVRYREVFL